LLLSVDYVKQLQDIPMLHFLQHQDFSYNRFFPALLYKLELLIDLYCDNHPCSFVHSLFYVRVSASTKMFCYLVIPNHCIVAGLVVTGVSLFFLCYYSSKHLFVQAFNFKVMFWHLGRFAGRNELFFFLLSQSVLFN